MTFHNDILIEIPESDLPKLRDYYKQHLPYATHIYSFLNTLLKWKRIAPQHQVCTLFAPNGDWHSDGTFIALLQFTCYDIMLFTLDKKCERLYSALRETKLIDFDNHMVLFYAIHHDHREAVMKAMHDRNIPILWETITDYWWMSREKAAEITVQCPDEYYIDILKPEHSAIINEEWPHKYDGSVEYVNTFITMNGGHGVFRKSDDKLVSWVLKNQMGTLGLLQTVEECQRKGLAALVTKSLSKEIALEGHNPLGTVLANNAPSQAMFRKLGFEILGRNSYIGAGKEYNTYD